MIILSYLQSQDIMHDCHKQCIMLALGTIRPCAVSVAWRSRKTLSSALSFGRFDCLLSAETFRSHQERSSIRAEAPQGFHCHCLAIARSPFSSFRPFVVKAISEKVLPISPLWVYTESTGSLHTYHQNYHRTRLETISQSTCDFGQGQSWAARSSRS